MKTSRLALCALAIAGAAPFASAQSFTNEEIERGLRMPNTVPYDGTPFMQRYNYSMNNANFYINGNPRFMWDIYWQDRIDRAQKFGYALPKSYEMGPLSPTFPRVNGFFAGGGFGILRR